MTPFEKFLTNYQILSQYDQIEMSSTMADDPEITKYCNITGGSGDRVGKFLGKSIVVVPDTRGVMFDKAKKK